MVCRFDSDLGHHQKNQCYCVFKRLLRRRLAKSVEAAGGLLLLVFFESLKNPVVQGARLALTFIGKVGISRPFVEVVIDELPIPAAATLYFFLRHGKRPDHSIVSNPIVRAA